MLPAMGAVNFRTIADLMRLGALLQVTCRACGHGGKFNAGDMVAFFGAGREIHSIPFRCRQCGSRDVAAHADHETLLVNRPRPAKPKSL